jgi:hypothetical protein
MEVKGKASSPVLASLMDTMTFSAAMQAVQDGKTITKLEWDNPDSICHFRHPNKKQGQILMIRRDGEWHSWIISYADTQGDDWIIITSHLI